MAAWSSTAATTGFVRGHQAPVTTNNRRVHQDPHHRCTRAMYKRSNLPPVSRSSYELDRSGCDIRLLRRDMSFATSVDNAVLTRCVQHLPPYLPADTPASVRPHLSWAMNPPGPGPRPASQCPRSLKPTHLASTTTAVHRGSCSQYSKGGRVIGIASESKGRIYRTRAAVGWHGKRLHAGPAVRVGACAGAGAYEGVCVEESACVVCSV
jgi:hypothetical protein